MRGDDFDPEKEELGAWYDALARKRGKVKSAVSLREFFDILWSLCFLGKTDFTRRWKRYGTCLRVCLEQ